jgi:hypothetical protein
MLVFESVVELRFLLTDSLMLKSQYIAWYREKYPEQGTLLDNVAEQLERAAYGLYAIVKLRIED